MQQKEKLKKELYKDIGLMIKRAENDNQEAVLYINYSVERLLHDVFHDITDTEYLMYDRCRQSCVLAFEFCSYKEKLLDDARESFSKIPVPDNYIN